VKTRTIKVDQLARVEGEGALHVRIRNERVEEVQLRIFEPPRFFEALLRGRRFSEAPDITARICGICPVAYQMSAVHAMERILGVELDAPLRDLRRVLYCGEWIESHGLHVYMLHAPDFLGYESAIHMAADHGETVRMALALKKVGNEVVALFGGREIHPHLTWDYYDDLDGDIVAVLAPVPAHPFVDQPLVARQIPWNLVQRRRCIALAAHQEKAGLGERAVFFADTPHLSIRGGSPVVPQQPVKSRPVLPGFDIGAEARQK